MTTDDHGKAVENESEVTDPEPAGEPPAAEDRPPGAEDAADGEQATAAADPAPVKVQPSSRTPTTSQKPADTQDAKAEGSVANAATGGELETFRGAFEVIDPTDPQHPDEFNIHPLPEFSSPIPEVQRQINVMAYGVWGTLKLLREQGVFDEKVDKGRTRDKTQHDIDQIRHRRFYEFRARVVQAARAGLEGEHVRPKLSLEALQQIKDEVATRVGMKIKVSYLLRLAIAAAGFIFLAGLFLAMIGTHRAAGYAWVVIGSMVGAWLSVASTRQTVSFEEIPSLLVSKFEPALRLGFVALLASALALLIELKTITLVLGGTELMGFSSRPPAAGETNPAFDPGIALLLGLVAGISEKAVSRKVIERARSAFTEEP